MTEAQKEVGRTQGDAIGPDIRKKLESNGQWRQYDQANWFPAECDHVKTGSVQKITRQKH